MSITEETKILELKKTPPLLQNRNRIVQLESGDPVVVERWSAEKLFAILDHLSRIISDVPEESLKEIATGSAAFAAGVIIKMLGPKVIGIVTLTVREEDRPKLEGMSAMDLLNLAEAMMEINVTEEFLKKAWELMAKGKRLFVQRTGPTPSKPPMCSSAARG